MKILTGIVARILYGVPLVIFGIMHFMNAKQMAGYVPSFFPFRQFLVYLTGLALIAAGVAIVTKIQDKLAALLLALMLAIFVLTIHLPGVFKEASRQMAMVSMLKDLGLIAGALLFARLSGKD